MTFDEILDSFFKSSDYSKLYVSGKGKLSYDINSEQTVVIGGFAAEDISSIKALNDIKLVGYDSPPKP